MARTLDARLQDILDAIEGIRQTLAGHSFESFAATWHLQKATERGLEIISEASRHIPAETKLMMANVPWTEIAGIGNVLRHDYQRVEALIIWNIVETHLAHLEEAAREIQNISLRPPSP
ncbi:HepT-like ribonuclease domain-containing protein [Asticcacaulis benevestitus]|uniref:DUF86 domain-containing protein n=1 Tax=Asticcacaulis benevestitus DSM 16100 = ATCC BAA-896 TaxID=1121022 RepID=V4PJL5_9CAUL|nr:HepT-like ribonuclease domain-containing protein [Asticcacaulis benevestitus]ESQ88406.1 hypothetical protein ABENE_16270 [Asticcacaulis benevestitus DSM 16100 = ATCC BAA-896]